MKEKEISLVKLNKLASECYIIVSVLKLAPQALAHAHSYSQTHTHARACPYRYNMCLYTCVYVHLCVCVCMYLRPQLNTCSFEFISIPQLPEQKYIKLLRIQRKKHQYDFVESYILLNLPLSTPQSDNTWTSISFLPSKFL